MNIKELLKSENINQLALEITKSYVISNHLNCNDINDYVKSFLPLYFTVKFLIKDLENSDKTIDEIIDYISDKYDDKETN